jgi:RNA polymerase sigma-70 factor (ECF subfamily)
MDDQAELIRALYEAHGPALSRYITRLTHDPGLAEDVVQETLTRAWRRPQILEQGEESTRAWLFTVARNLVIDDRRSARAAHEFTTGQLPENANSDHLESTLDKWLLSDALTSLSLEHRRVIVRSYYLGQSAAEISEEEGVPEGTVRSRAHYALRALRLALQERGVTQ